MIDRLDRLNLLVLDKDTEEQCHTNKWLTDIELGLTMKVPWEENVIGCENFDISPTTYVRTLTNSRKS